MKLNIGVLFGGNSTEHDISIITALQVMNNLDKRKYNIIPLYLTHDNELLCHKKLLNIETYKQNINNKFITYSIYRDSGVVRISNVLKKFQIRKKIDLIFNCTHGFKVEDGTISGLLNYLQIPYSSPDVLASSICQDKDFTKQSLKNKNINVLEHIVLNEENKKDLNLFGKDIKYPVIIKPVHLGSSIGIKIAHDYNELIDAVNYAFIYDNKLIIEKYLHDAKEYSIAVYKRKNELVLSRIELVNKNAEIFDFKEKYVSDKKQENHIYLEEDQPLSDTIKDIVVDIYKDLEMKGIVRIDFIESDQLYVNEINTTPGSLSYYLFKNISFKTLLDEQVRQMLYEHNLSKKYKTSFETSVLNSKYKFNKK